MNTEFCLVKLEIKGCFFTYRNQRGVGLPLNAGAPNKEQNKTVSYHNSCSFTSCSIFRSFKVNKIKKKYSFSCYQKIW